MFLFTPTTSHAAGLPPVSLLVLLVDKIVFFPLVELLMMPESLQPHRMYFPLSAPRQEAATAHPTLIPPVKHSNRSQQYSTSLVTGNQQRHGKGTGSGIKAQDWRIYFPQSNSCSPNTISFNNITLNS